MAKEIEKNYDRMTRNLAGGVPDAEELEWNVKRGENWARICDTSRTWVKKNK